jgi:beta-N-acetylhexosaminidase
MPSVDPALERLASSVVLPGFLGTTAPDWLLRRVGSGLRGVCWFGQNVADPEQVRRLADQLHAAGDGVLVASDEEGGEVTRLEAATGSTYPGASALGALDDVTATRAVAAAMGGMCRSAGVDVVLGPVADVNADPDNPVIGVRSFGSTSELVSRHVAAFVSGLQSSGVAACAKHYPGHGSTVEDSHLGLPTVADPQPVLRERDLAPFGAAVAAGVRCVMTAHVVYPAFDREPATLSPVLLRLLRDELGFDGVVITDALDMRAISAGVGVGEGAVRALAAGADLLCIGNPAFPEPYDPEARLELVLTAVSRAVASGRLPVERLEQAAGRVDQLNTWVGSPAAEPEDAEQSAVAVVAARSIELRGDVAVRAPVLLDLRGAVSIAAGGRGQHLAAALTARDRRTTVVEVDGHSPAEALAVARSRDVVVTVRSPREARTRDLVDAVLAARPDAVVVQTGLAEETPAARLVRTHGGGRAVAEAAAAVLVPEVHR